MQTRLRKTRAALVNQNEVTAFAERIHNPEVNAIKRAAAGSPFEVDDRIGLRIRTVAPEDGDGEADRGAIGVAPTFQDE